jgi:fatty acid amide hydrolase
MALWQRSATDLAAMLARGEVSSREVLLAHLDRIGRTEGRIQAFTEVLKESSLDEADASDARRRRGEARGPLDGLPVTVKECFDIAGRATTLGIPSWRSRIAARDATMVTTLREAGAVILGRTNLSQTMLFAEASNPIFGRTNNPWSQAHSPGGSSGGEGAAVASGMSPLGVGTDIGGSIRTPCHFSGVCGIKPTLDRLPMLGYRGVLVGQEAVRGMGGPMARTVADLGLFFGALDPVRMSELDPRVPPLGWEKPDTVRVDKITVGRYDDDGVLPASPAIVRALDRAQKALQARGCTVRPFKLPDARALVATYLGALSADDGAAMFAALEGGDIDPVLEPMRQISALPLGVRRLMAAGAKAAGQPNLALMLGAMGAKSAAELWRLTDALRAYRAELLAEMDRSGVDALLCPPCATPAFPHGASKNFTLASSYTIVFNATQFPAGVVPVTRVQPGETKRATTGRDAVAKRAARVDARSLGLPVGVQIAARPWRDHVALALMGAIEAEVTRDEAYPASPVPLDAA